MKTSPIPTTLEIVKDMANDKLGCSPSNSPISRERAIRLATKRGRSLRHLSVDHRSDKEVVFRAVKQDGNALAFASDELKRSRIVVRAAVGQCGLSLLHADQKHKNNAKTVLIAVKQNGAAIEYASTEMQGNRRIAHAAVRNHGKAIIFVSEELQDNHAICLDAVRQDPDALEYVSDRISCSEEIVMAAVGQSGSSLRFAAPHLQTNRKLCIIAARSNPDALGVISEDLCDTHLVEPTARSGKHLSHDNAWSGFKSMLMPTLTSSLTYSRSEDSGGFFLPKNM